MFYVYFAKWLYLNHRPLVLEATALPTEPQPLPISNIFTIAKRVEYEGFLGFIFKLTAQNFKNKTGICAAKL